MRIEKQILHKLNGRFNQSINQSISQSINQETLLMCRSLAGEVLSTPSVILKEFFQLYSTFPKKTFQY